MIFIPCHQFLNKENKTVLSFGLRKGPMEKDLRPRQEEKFNFSIVVTSKGMKKNLNQFAPCTNILLPQNIITMFIKLLIFYN